MGRVYGVSEEGMDGGKERYGGGGVGECVGLIRKCVGVWGR